MKYVVLAFFVLIASQPTQVVSCDMQAPAQASQHGSNNMDHGNMDHGDVSDMDCCDHDPASPSDNCDSMVDCSACAASVMVFNVFTAYAIFKTDPQLVPYDIGEPLSRFNPPPYKPPIA